jgi:hypothetical protein
MRKRVASQELLPPRKTPLNPDVSLYHKQIFSLVFPYVFPGSYLDQRLAFRTFLALAGTCQALRYWNLLRRWIGWLSPVNSRPLLQKHGFPVCMRISQIENFQKRAANLIQGLDVYKGHSDPIYCARALNAAASLETGMEKEKIQSNFELDVGGVPFFNIIECYTVTEDMKSCNTTIYLAPTFAEMVLFCHAALSHKAIGQKIRMFACIPVWEKSQGFIHFSDSGKVAFMNRYLLGRLRKIGMTAPQDVGFLSGPLPQSAYAFFCHHCDTSGRRSKLTIADRLTAFVEGWFPRTIHPLNEDEARKLATDLRIKFV